MTPEELIKKYKDNISGYLQDGDQEILEAYINLQVREAEERVRSGFDELRWFSTLTNYGSTLIVLGLILLILVATVMGISSCADRDLLYMELTAECDRKLLEDSVRLQACQADVNEVRVECLDSVTALQEHLDQACNVANFCQQTTTLCEE